MLTVSSYHLLPWANCLIGSVGNFLQSSVQNVAAAPIGTDLTLFRSKKNSLTIGANVFPALSDPGRGRLDTKTAYFVKVFSDLSWTVSF
jgi:hypothetical protein